MKILFVVRNISYGGACKQIRMTADALASYGHDVYVYTYNDNKSLQSFKKAIYLPEDSVGRSKWSEYLFAVPRIRRKIKALSPDIVISWRANAGCFTQLASVGCNVKHLFSERTDPYMETNTMLKVATKICDQADCGVFQTEGAQQFYKKLCDNKSIVIPNPISIPKEIEVVPYSQREDVIVCLGRMFMPQKRMDILLKAFVFVHKKCPNVILRFYGDGPDMEQTKQIANDLGVFSNVDFAGATATPLIAIRTAKMLVLSSDYEGIPNVLLEAMSVGVPVITTDTSPGGARQILDNGKYGDIVPIRDYEALAERMIYTYEHPEYAEDLIAKGQDRVADYEPNVIFEKWNSYISLVCHDSSKF